MYRSDHEAARARAQMAHDRLRVLYERERWVFEVPPPHPELATAQLEIYANEIEFAVAMLDPQARQWRDREPATFEEARERLDGARAEWHSLARAIRAHSPTLALRAKAKDAAFDADGLIGIEPVRPADETIAAWTKAATVVESRSELMRDALAPFAESIPRVPIAEVEGLKLEFVRGRPGPPGTMFAGAFLVVFVVAYVAGWWGIPALIVALLIVGAQLAVPSVWLSHDERALKISTPTRRDELRFESIESISLERGRTRVPFLFKATLRIVERDGKRTMLTFNETAPGTPELLSAWFFVLQRRFDEATAAPAELSSPQ